jgi:hypothetical protein
LNRLPTDSGEESVYLSRCGPLDRWNSGSGTFGETIGPIETSLTIWRDEFDLQEAKGLKKNRRRENDLPAAVLCPGIAFT